jgi:hypothetical protein
MHLMTAEISTEIVSIDLGLAHSKACWFGATTFAPPLGRRKQSNATQKRKIQLMLKHFGR